MNFDRSLAGAQFISDLLIKQTGNNQLQHFVLAVGQQVISPAQLGNFSSLLAARDCRAASTESSSTVT